VGRTVVIPFGVPTGSEGLGLGLASMLYTFGAVKHEGLALAQLMTAPKGSKATSGTAERVNEFETA
jgi:hypothetical protein